MAEIISLVVVLPLLPVTATTGSVKLERQAVPMRPSAASVSPSTSWGSATSATGCATTAAQAPADCACGR
ncbi:Uncharacterised protein [Bordetella pertussis]|nr:Uncharacterised protein [Bordetella pertussis]CPO10647.1 Uncharacterised protein [Bordetella pertussis]CPP75549.1 Uncharacterised protein [Bordetella pertussis]CPQ57878.1 Uncharacterised protein [Bordetella pertussis]CRE33075.1 Uncharacterised protein [Bordetella pertussis]